MYNGQPQGKDKMVDWGCEADSVGGLAVADVLFSLSFEVWSKDDL